MELLFATHNLHKLEEVQAVLSERIHLISLSEVGCNEELPEEQETLEGNALQKAQYVWNKYHRPCFADDTGLEVDALGGAPGVHSARYATDGHDFGQNIRLLLRNMEGKNDRTARFRSVLALILEDGMPHLFAGSVEGEILTECHGFGGFGYDAAFRPDGYDLSFGELPLEEKNRISHRGAAVRKMCDYLLTVTK